MTHTTHIAHRTLSFLAGTALLLMPSMAASQTTTTLRFVPTCSLEQGNGESVGFGGEIPDIDVMVPPGQDGLKPCQEFAVRDPQTLETKTLKEGDELSIAVVIENPTEEDVSRVRSWIAYDPEILEGKEIEIDSAFPTVTPGESDFAPEEGYVKIGATAKNSSDEKKIVVARITFVVKKTSAASTPLSFYDLGATDDKHTYVIAAEGTTEKSLLTSPTGTLLVQLKTQTSSAAETSVASSVSSTATVPSSAAAVAEASSTSLKGAAESSGGLPPTAPPVSNTTIFPNLQVSNLRVTTQGTAVYLGWDALASGELVGYNIYYGATSGQYLQRKTIDKSETTLTIRNLPENVVYYFSVRGTNAAGVETEFSPEVSVTVGKPQTSTAPLSASLITGPNGKPPKTGGNVAGDTGTASTAALLLIACAVIGTMIASRRQCIALTTPPHVA